MKFSTTAALALALSVTSVLGQEVQVLKQGSPTCTGNYFKMFNLNRKWMIHAMVPDVDAIPDICGGLWDNLKKFPICTPNPDAGCENKWEGIMTWRFGTVGICNDGMIQAVWWEATRNKFGPLKCTSKKRL
ncbi:hypothetical protein CaCOL14_011764 [Colletotrichum acutatum]